MKKTAAQTLSQEVTDPSLTPAALDLHSPEYTLNRKLSWLEFNKRILSKAADARNPLLERVFFLTVVHSNLDEFYMKHIGGLKQQVGAGAKLLSSMAIAPWRKRTTNGHNDHGHSRSFETE